MSARLAAAARRTVVGATLAAALLGAAGTRAGAQASPYVPLDDVAYAYVDALQARGALGELPLLARPYTAAAIARAIRASTPMTGVAAGWLDALGDRVALYAPTGGLRADTSGAVAITAAIAARATARTGTRDEPLLADDEAGAYPGGQLRVAAVAGPVVVGARYVLDQAWTDDPDYPGYVDGGVAGRVEEGYVAGQWRYGELLFGRLARSWGPPRHDGLLIGPAAPYDHLAGRVGVEALNLSLLVARLDDEFTAGEPLLNRWLVAHRVAGRWRGVEAALAETYVYAGAGRGLEPSIVNPLAPVLLTNYNEAEGGNVGFTADVAFRSRLGTLAVQALVDDYQFERGAATTEEAASYGVTTSAEGLPLWGAQRWFASYTRVSSLAYRTPAAGEDHAIRGVGLGRPFADYDEARLGLDLALLPWAPVRLYGATRRQGSGDFRAPFPPVEDYATTPGFLIGAVSRTTRVGIESAGRLDGLAWALDVGYNRVTGAGRTVPGARGATVLAPSGVAGRLTLTWEPAWLRASGTLR